MTFCLHHLPGQDGLFGRDLNEVSTPALTLSNSLASSLLEPLELVERAVANVFSLAKDCITRIKLTQDKTTAVKQTPATVAFAWEKQSDNKGLAWNTIPP